MFAHRSGNLDLAEGEFRSIEYRSLDGEKQRGWLLLPSGHDPRKRYPLITYVYLGLIMGDTPPSMHRAASGSSLNTQIASAQGFAVLFPSMPVPWEKEVLDPMLLLPNGVLPAVDKVVDLGIADPERIFVMGHSFGGFSTNGLVTQTQRFKAAVSAAGSANLVSYHSAFHPGLRYAPFPHENMFGYYGLETGWYRFNNPPWRDLGRYLRNSPITYVDRVTTPVLFVHGDMDYVPIEQAEEFFSALYRQGKRAGFARYWGEGHLLESPANIRDMWSRIFAWFDEHGDIARDANGELLWDGDRVQSRRGAPPLQPEDYLKFERMFDQDFPGRLGRAVQTGHNQP